MYILFQQIYGKDHKVKNIHYINLKLKILKKRQLHDIIMLNICSMNGDLTKMGIREQKKKQRKAEILRISLDLFIRKGYSNCKISDIAKEANMSMGLMFHYFESKEVLFNELINMGINTSRVKINNSLDDPLEILTKVVQDYLDLTRNNKVASNMYLLIERSRVSLDVPEEMKDKLNNKDFLENIISIIEAGQEKGEIKEGNSHLLAITLMSALRGILENIILNEEEDIPEASWIIDLIRK